MGINLTEISQKVLDTVGNAANIFRKMYDLHYNPTPMDVPMEYVDENGVRRTTNVPNRSKLKADFEAWKDGVIDLFPNINVYKDTSTFGGKTTDSTDIPTGFYGWTESISRSYAYRLPGQADYDNGLPKKTYMPNFLICQEHWSANANSAKLAVPNAIAHSSDWILARKISAGATLSFWYRAGNATGNFKERLELTGFIVDGMWHFKVIRLNGGAYSGGYWPAVVSGIESGSEVDFEYALFHIFVGYVNPRESDFVEYIAK